ncbi:MAG: hypothetical protein Q8L79_01365 [Methylobacter sp.]|uniref:hypothetical protein n=1 Tax=Methylobacter sp. TaxID=2051955 RepID=UPI0027316A86|nr:hypothetical protein [Methylobacter sp.]MDP1663746.1 hypothetical protein [Methylobacter sp.]
MDPVSASTSFATIVGLLSDFVSHRKNKQSLEITDFVEWLRAHGHSEIMQAIESNHVTAISIKAVLAEGQETLLGRLQSIEHSLATLCAKQGPFGDVAESLYPKIPKNLLEHLRPGVPRERVAEILGQAHKVCGRTWWYCCPSALVQIEFYDDGGASSVAIALTIGSPDSGFILPMHSTTLGKITLSEVMEDEGEFRFRSTLRTEELLFQTRIGPPGAWKYYTFGVLRPLASGALAEGEFEWNYENQRLLSSPESVRINWVGISESSEELWFDWSIALP